MTKKNIWSSIIVGDWVKITTFDNTKTYITQIIKVSGSGRKKYFWFKPIPPKMLEIKTIEKLNGEADVMLAKLENT
jgi:hypothetical protein